MNTLIPYLASNIKVWSKLPTVLLLIHERNTLILLLLFILPLVFFIRDLKLIISSDINIILIICILLSVVLKKLNYY